MQPPLPAPRGPLTSTLFAALTGPPGGIDRMVTPADPSEDDLQLALYCCYELHYRSFAGIADEWEWDPGLLRLRRALEAKFERRLYEEVAGTPEPPRVPIGEALTAIIATSTGPSLSAHMADAGTVDQLQEFCVHRSAYQLKEADPHTWALPRIHGPAKAAMVEIQTDEYGNGAEADMHATLFAGTLRALGLDDTYGAYLDLLPPPTLATVNLVSLFGLHRRWRGALVGHLAVFEMASVVPMSCYARACTALGFGEEARRFYDVHVAADAHHEVVARDVMAEGLARSEPDLVSDILFGARALMAVEAEFAQYLLGRWARGLSSLRRPLPGSALAA